MDKISAVIITYNASATIGNCIDALKKVCDEIIVIDSFSTDNTADICRQKNILFFKNEWTGYGPQKNIGISKATHDFILSVDADEIINDELANEIITEKQIGLHPLYNIVRSNFYYTDFVQHGAEAPSPILRLFNRHIAKWDNKSVHENLIISGQPKIKTLKGYLLHYSYTSIEHHIHKANGYTTLSAQDLYTKRKKNYIFKMIFSPPINFFVSFFIRRGFLDGIHGFILATFVAHASFIKYAKLWEMYKRKNL